MGSSIQNNSSLNFRHDSSLNPEFQEYFKGYNDRHKLNFQYLKEKSREEIQRQMVNKIEF
jgi:hypothetical protein